MPKTPRPMPVIKTPEPTPESSVFEPKNKNYIVIN